MAWTGLDAAQAQYSLACAAAAQAAAQSASDPAGAAAAAQAASQPLDSDLTAIAALSTTSYGRALLTLANAGAARAYLGAGGWTTALDIDLAAQPTQTLTTNGIYTIGGVAGWKRENAANDRVPLVLTNGAGIVFKPGVSAYDGATRTAPLLWLSLASLGISLDWSTKFRVWVQATDGYASGGVFNLGDGLAFGIDSDSFRWCPAMQRASIQGGPTGSGLRRFQGGGASNGVLKNVLTTDIGAAGSWASNPCNVMRLEIPALYGEAVAYKYAWDKTSANWPAVDASSLVPTMAIVNSSMGANEPINANNLASLASLGANLGIALACSNGGANDKYEVTVSKIRVDYSV